MTSRAKEMKACSKCTKEQPINEFPERVGPSGRSRRLWCRECQKKIQAEYYQARREELKVLRAEYYSKNKEKIAKRQAAWYETYRHPEAKRRLKRLPGETRAQAEHRRQQGIRVDAIKHYGGSCFCCGESQLEFLAIDHIFNDGAGERKVVGSGSKFYYWLRDNNYPPFRYQVLCHNCNLAKGFYGACPHLRLVRNLVSAA